MTHDELARRRPVWAAMAELFLDTEVRWAVPSVAKVCADSGYDDDALERIFWGEVFPEAIPNLLSVAGEWAGLTLDEAALIKRANTGSIPWLTRRAHGSLVQDVWLATREVTGWLRADDAETRATRARVLSALGRKFFDDAPLVLEGDAERTEWARYEAVCLRLKG